MDLFLTNMQLFTSQDVNWWTGGVDYLWIIVVFYQLFGLPFWRHPSLQRIHWLASDLMLHFSKSVLMKKQTQLYRGWPDGEYIFSRFSVLGELFL